MQNDQLLTKSPAEFKDIALMEMWLICASLSCPNSIILQLILVQWRVAKEVAGAHEKAITCIAGHRLTPYSTLFASTSSDGTVRIWQASLTKEAGGIFYFLSPLYSP